jgi:hypothetical protein
MAGALAAFYGKPLLAQIASGGRTTVSPDGIIRTTLE